MKKREKLTIENEEVIRQDDGLLSQNEPRYRIGELSEIFHLHPQTIRYFDREGLVDPSRNTEGGQRRYSNYDMYLITLRMQYRNLGFSIHETNDIFHAESLPEMQGFLQTSEERLKEEQRLLDIKKRGLKKLQDKVDRIPQELDSFSFRRRPAMWRFPHMINGTLIESREASEARKILLECMPLAYYSFSFEQNCRKGINSYVWDIAAEEKDALLMKLNQIPAAYRVPSENCLYTVFRIDGDTPISRSVLNRAFQYLKDHELEADGTVYGSAVINLTDGEKSIRYFEAWIPWRKKQK